MNSSPVYEFSWTPSAKVEAIRERTRAGLVAAKRAGRTGGRPSELTDDDLDAARTLLANPDITVADRLGVSPATLYRYLPAAQTIHAAGA